MIGDSQWIEGFLYKVMARARELINQQAHSFRDSLERWLALNWPILMLPGWEVRFNNFLRDWRADGVILQPESAQQLFDYLSAQSEQMRAEGVQLPERLPTLQSLLPTREQALRPAGERHFPDDLPAPFDPAYPQLRRTGNSIMQRYPPEDWLRRAEQVLKSYRVPEEIAKQFLAWIAAEQKKRAAPAVPFLAELESFGPADLHPLAVCFAAGTPILTRRGQIAIEQVVGGDEVPAVPETDPLAPIRWCRVEQSYHNNPAELIDIHVSDLPVIRATLNHPFFVRGKGFIAAQLLCPGDLLRTADDRWLPVSQTLRDGAIEPVYNLCVAECHTYFAAGVLVHNQSFDPLEAPPRRLDVTKSIENADGTVTFSTIGADGVEHWWRAPIHLIPDATAPQRSHYDVTGKVEIHPSGLGKLILNHAIGTDQGWAKIASHFMENYAFSGANQFRTDLVDGPASSAFLNLGKTQILQLTVGAVAGVILKGSGKLLRSKAVGTEVKESLRAVKDDLDKIVDAADSKLPGAAEDALKRVEGHIRDLRKQAAAAPEPEIAAQLSKIADEADEVYKGAKEAAKEAARASSGVKLTGSGKRILKDPALQAMKDASVADVIRARGGGGSQVNQVPTNLRNRSLGDVANLAAEGDEAALTAIKLVKQAESKAQKYKGKK